MAKYDAEAKKINSERQDWQKEQTVIFTLSESFSDPSRLKDITLNNNPFPFITQLSKETTSGLMLSSGYGGGTANMEWQSLTGMDLSNLGATLPVPYTQLVNKQKKTPTFLNLFDEAVAIHPFSANTYSRLNVFEKFGFDKFHYIGSPDGLNYTQKIEANPYISDEAARIGAVNTVMLKANKLYGYNTDYFGIKVMLKSKNINVKNKTAVILGSGGACKAVITYLLDNEVEKIYIVSRTPESVNLNKIDKKISIINYNELNSIKGYLIINTTPVGMFPNVDNSAVSKEVIKNFDVAVDLVYNPTQTKFLQFATEEGKVAIGGLHMLVGQAVKSQAIFNDREISEELINYIYDDLSKDFK